MHKNLIVSRKDAKTQRVFLGGLGVLARVIEGNGLVMHGYNPRA